MAVRTGGPAPYAPPGTVMQLINGFRDRGLATPFTPDVLVRAGVTESLVPRALRSMVLLELIDEAGNPTPAMEGLRRASSEDFRGRLADIVRGVYSEVFQFANPATDPPSKVADAFRAYEPIGQRSRMVTLFLGLCEAAGIIPEGSARKQAPSGATRKPSVGGASTRAVAKRGPTTAGPAGMRIQHGAGQHDLIGPNGSVSPALLGLIGSIPRGGWTAVERNKFVTAFEHVLDFTVPIREPGATLVDEQEEGDDE